MMNIGLLVVFQLSAVCIVCSGQTEPISMPILLGENVEFLCSKVSADAFYFWYQNSKVLAIKEEFPKTSTPDRYSITGNDAEYKLVISNVQEEDEGTYSCEVSESQPQLNKKFQLTVNIPPTVRIDPNDIEFSVEENGQLYLDCDATGKPAPTVKWVRQGGQLFFDGEKEKQVKRLKFENIGKESSGNYTCVADNGFGETAKDNVQINVRYKPTVAAEEHFIHTGPGDNIFIKCSFMSSPVANATWKFNNLVINKNSINNLKVKTTTDKENAVSILEIDGVNKNNFGMYTCVGDNKWGTAMENIVVSGIPEILDVRSGNENKYVNQYTLQWVVQSKATILKYHLLLQVMNESTGPILDREVTVLPSKNQHQETRKTQAYSINDLLRNSTYIVNLQAENVVGVGGWSEKFEFKTPADGEEAPANVKDYAYDIENGSSRNVFSWTALVMLCIKCLL